MPKVTGVKFAEAVLQEFAIMADVLHVGEATGHNDGVAVEEIQKACGLSRGDNWCAATLTVCIMRACNKLGISWQPFMPDVILKTGVIQDRGRVHAWLRAYKQLGLAANSIKFAARGRPFLWVKSVLWISAGHIGDTAEVRVDEFRTIEGNSRNRVDRRWRDEDEHNFWWLLLDRHPVFKVGG